SQRLAAVVTAIPVCLALNVITVMEQEVKAERGAFTTMHEIVEAAGQASFVEGSLDFIHYERIWVPGLLCGVLAVGLVAFALRRRELAPWRDWAVGFGSVMLGALVVAPVLVTVQARASSRLSPAALGDPLSSLVETAVDLARNQTPLKPSELLLQQAFTTEEAVTGAARLGWPPRGETPCPHPHARLLDREAEPAPPGAALLTALEKVSEQLFADGDPNVAALQFSLESFRADDLHALHAAAPEGLHPFVNGLYAGKPGVLASRRMFQAGVRSAQGLAAMTCGLGTLPYNLSIIRDFENFPLRCAPDLLAEAGFEGRFFYGSDPHFDAMASFVKRHGVQELVTQDELPKDLPTGAWDGLTDFAVFDAAVQRVKDRPGSQYALVMSLSNHSPYTTPQDVPAFVPERVDAALARVPHRGGVDDRRRLIANSYTDAALERFFRALDDAQLSERSIVVLLADHSTGEDYVWGPDSVEHETDEAKTLVPFLIVIPEAFLARVKDRPALEAALAEAQRQLEAQPLSQNDVPALLLALLHSHPGLR
ncbi:MAG TPA: sulfatase-like hydrolase/transferase, partial [Archangium sp.]